MQNQTLRIDAADDTDEIIVIVLDQKQATMASPLHVTICLIEIHN